MCCSGSRSLILRRPTIPADAFARLQTQKRGRLAFVVRSARRHPQSVCQSIRSSSRLPRGCPARSFLRLHWAKELKNTEELHPLLRKKSNCVCLRTVAALVVTHCHTRAHTAAYSAPSAPSQTASYCRIQPHALACSAPSVAYCRVLAPIVVYCRIQSHIRPRAVAYYHRIYINAPESRRCVIYIAPAFRRCWFVPGLRLV